MSRRILIWQILLLGPLCAPLPAAGPLQLNLQVASGERVPGGGAEMNVFGRIFGVQHNDRNQVAFTARVGESPTGVGLDGTAWGVFFRDESGIRKVILEGDPLPGGASARFDEFRQPGLALNNAGEVAVVIPSQGIILDHQGQLQWLVQAGQAAPDTGAAFAAFDSLVMTRIGPEPPLFDDAGNFALLADLSDGGRGVFLAGKEGVVRVASSGQGVPGRQGLQFGSGFSTPVLRGGWVLFIADAGNRRGIFRFTPSSQLQTAVLEGELLPNGLGVLLILEADINASGSTVFQALVQPGGLCAVLLGTPGEWTTVVQAGDVLPGFPGPGPRQFGSLSLDDRGRLFLRAETSDQVGFYLWEEGNFLKIALDGDPTPLGGTFLLGTPNDSAFPISLPPRSFSMTRMNNAATVAFKSTLVGSDTGSEALFIWRNGTLAPIPGIGSSPPGLGDRLIDNLHPESINESGSVLLTSSLCCGTAGSAVFVTEAAPPQESFLPFVTLGEGTDSLHSRTLIELLNHSRFPGFVELEVYDQDGILAAERSQILLGGERWSLDLLNGFHTATGYVRLSIDGGAEIGLQGLIQLLESHRVFSQTAVDTQPPLTKAGLIVEADSQADSGIALTNLDDGPANLELRLFSRDGQPAFARTIALDPRSQSSLFVSELFPDLERPFIGYLEIASATPFLAAGLRQAELQLSTLPVDDGRAAPEQALGFVNVFPALPPKDFNDFGTEFLEDVMLGPGDRLAIFSKDGEIYLVDDEEPFAVLTENTVLPAVQMPPVLDSRVRLLGFMADGGLVLSTPFTQQTADGPLGNQGLFRWRSRRLEKLFIEGDPLPDGTFASIDDAVLSPGGKLLLKGIQNERTSFFVLEGDSLQEAYSEEALISLQFLDSDDSGNIAYLADQQRLELISGGQKTIVARLGDIVGDRVRLTTFGPLELRAPNRLFFLAGGDSKAENGQFRTGLFLYDGEAVTPLLVSGDPLPGISDAAVGPLDLDYDGLGKTFHVNASGAAVVRTPILAADSTSLQGFVLIDKNLEKRLIVPDPAQPLTDSPSVPTPNGLFDWNDNGQLLFQARPAADHLSVREALFVWQGDESARLVSQGAPVSAAGDPLSLIRMLYNGWRVSGQKVYFQARIAGAETSGLYAAASDNPQQHLIPHVVWGRFDPLDYQTALLLRNGGERSASVSVRLFDSEGHKGPQVDALQLAPGEVRSVALDSEDPFTGWARVDATGGSIRVFSRISARRSGAPFSEVTIPEAGLRPKGFWFGAGSALAGMDGGIALTNPYNAPIRVTIDSLDQGFAVRRQAEVSLPAKGHRALLFSEIFAGQTLYSGFFRLRSDFPVPAAALLLNGLHISSQPIFHPADP